MEKHTEPLLYNITIVEHVNVPFNHGLVWTIMKASMFIFTLHYLFLVSIPFEETPFISYANIFSHLHLLLVLQRSPLESIGTPTATMPTNILLSTEATLAESKVARNCTRIAVRIHICRTSAFRQQMPSPSQSLSLHPNLLRRTYSTWVEEYRRDYLTRREECGCKP